MNHTLKQIAAMVVVLLMSSAVSLAQSNVFTTLQQAAKKLSTYRPEEMRESAKTSVLQRQRTLIRIYNDLDAATALLKTQAPSEELAFQMERVALIAIIAEPYAEGVAIILPAYMKYPKVFESAAKYLHEEDEKLILATLRGQKDAEEHPENN